jgi:capsular polysaccharide biosynthesis protein
LIGLKYQYDGLQSELARIKKMHDEIIVPKMNQMDIERWMEDSGTKGIVPIREATLPFAPEETKKMVILIAGFLGGIAGGVALTFVLAAMDHTFKTPEQVEEKLQLPTLVAIPRVRANRAFLKRRLRGRAHVSAN